MARDATVFPQAIGLASTWDPALARSLAEAIGGQMRAVGAHHGLAPVLDVCRDPRWGRTEETFGEDPYLVARMGVAFVQGLQGESLRDGVIATAKHFVGYGASDGGMNWAPAGIPPRELREVYLHPFEAAVRVGRVGSVMNAYNEVDGVVCTADRELLTAILRDEWGFDGYVVSDYFSIRQLESYHRLAADGQEAAAMAIGAGLDLELPSTDCYGRPLLDALEVGLVSEHTVDDAVRRVLGAKFELGLFDDPYVDAARAADAVGTSSHRVLARTIARKSIVLLKNDGILPLSPELTSIAVIGPNADTARNLFGDYCYPAHVESLREVLASGGSPLSSSFETLTEVEEAEAQGLSVVDAMRQRFGPIVSFAHGCDVSGSSREGFDEGVELARASEVAVLVMGDKAGLAEDCTSGEFRDRASLDLPGIQEELVRAVVATGTPVVLVLVSGRPSASEWVHEHCAAVIEAWFPGEEGAVAVAEVLGGEVNPGGKLPISFPRSVGQIPVFYAHKVSGGRSQPAGDYVDLSARPLYPFGHGLSYTTFELSGARVREQTVGTDGEIVVDVVAANTGGRRETRSCSSMFATRGRASRGRYGAQELRARRARSRRVADDHVPCPRRAARLLRPGALVRRRAGRDPGVRRRSSDDLIEAGKVTVAEGPRGSVRRRRSTGRSRLLEDEAPTPVAEGGGGRSSGVSLDHVSKVFPGEVKAVDDVSLEIGEGEFMVLVGPSGCGKSTLLRLMAGLEQLSSGSIMIGGVDVSDTAPQDRDIAMVFQNYALYPHMTVYENLEFGLKRRKVPKEERARRVADAAETLGLEELLDRKPAALSGGQRQRVAIGRALVRDPVAFLMDEPLSNLDAKLRVSMRSALARLHERLGVTTVYVTHDQVEAMTLGQRVAVIRDGRLQQVDTPQTLFNAPANLFVAAFIGSPSMNLVEADVHDGEIHFGGYRIPVPAGHDVPRGSVLVGIRPTDFEHTGSADPSLPRIRVRADIVEELGAESHVMFRIDAPRVTAEAVRAAADTRTDEEAETLFTDDERAEFTARVDSRFPVAAGSEVDLAVHVDGLHFFEPETGNVIDVGRPKLGRAASPAAAPSAAS